MTPRLSVTLNREPLGSLTLHGGDERYELEYAPAWLAGAGAGYPVSPHLQPDDCRPDSVKRFLANLLPEGKWLEELSINYQISKNNIFGLVALIGAETTGALTFRPEGEERQVTNFRPVRPEELAERIAGRQAISIAQWDGRPRLSVAGVQDKLPVLIMPDGTMGFGEGDLASTHILKFGQRADMHMLVNEFICMELARLVKMPVATVALQRWGEPVLLVERFDRHWHQGRVERLHLIDGCQMLDLPPTYKYERPFGTAGEGATIRIGASLAALFDACRYCRVPARAMRDLLNWCLFQLLIGNSDAHGKNISFFVGREGIDMAPCYDLLNIAIYGGEFNRDLAMAIGGEFALEGIFSYQLAEFCEECKLPQRQVARSLKALCLALLQGLERLRLDALLKDEHDFARKMMAIIKKNTVRFLDISEELPQDRV